MMFLVNVDGLLKPSKFACILLDLVFSYRVTSSLFLVSRKIEMAPHSLLIASHSLLPQISELPPPCAPVGMTGTLISPLAVFFLLDIPLR